MTKRCGTRWASCSPPSAACAARPEPPGRASATQVRALFQLERGEACAAGELAKRADLSPAFDDGDARTTRADPGREWSAAAANQDQRQVVVTLTEAGHETLAAKRAEVEAHTAQVLGPYSEAEPERGRTRHAVARRDPGFTQPLRLGRPSLKMGLSAQCSASPAPTPLGPPLGHGPMAWPTAERCCNQPLSLGRASSF